MGRNLLRKGYALCVYDVDPAAVAALAKDGATAAASPAGAAQNSDLVITVLPDGPQVESAILETAGALGSARPGTIFVECSTVDPIITERVGTAMRQKGYSMVDAAMGRGPQQAEEGKLFFMVGATQDDFAVVLPVLQAMGTDIVHCGGPCAGIAMKLVLNLLSISIMAADLEAFVLGAKAGLDFETMARVLALSLADNRHIPVTMREQVLPGKYEPGFKASLAHKDLGLAMNMAARLGVPLFALNGARQLFSLAISRGKGERTMSVIGAVLEDLTGTSLGRSAGQ
jgi:4-hydroxybutyrate dehydrogenase/sulfolactaldehyde 3-reductase